MTQSEPSQNSVSSAAPAVSKLPKLPISSALKIPLLAVAGVALIGAAYLGYSALSKNSGIKTTPALKDSISTSEYANKTDKTASDTIKVYGKVSQLGYDSYSFTLTSGGASLTIAYDQMQGKTPVPVTDVTNDSYIVVTGSPSPDGYSFWASKIEPTTEADVNAYTNARKPSLSMTITSYPTSLKHGCSPLSIGVKLRNSGVVPIAWSDMSSAVSTPRYMLYYSVNGVSAGSYSQSLSDSGTVGFKDFGTIYPGEEVDAVFMGGGAVIQGVNKEYSDAQGTPYVTGTAGRPNIIAYNSQSGGIAGANSIQFKFAVMKEGSYSVLYDPDYRSESNTVTINLENRDCDLTDITETVYQ